MFFFRSVNYSRNMKKSAILLFTLLIIQFYCFLASAQTDGIQTLTKLFEDLALASDDHSKIKIDKLINDEIETNIVAYEDFEALKKIQGLFPVISDDGYVKLFTWGYSLSDNSNRYSGVINYYLKETGRNYTERLTHSPLDQEELESKIVSSENWYGAVYYDIVSKKFKGHNYYLLLGYDGYNDFINIKMIDALVLEEDAFAKFGSPVFGSVPGSVNRLVFRYGERLSMLLKYDRENKVIIWDHLSPSKPELKGYFEYYGPDMTYDALKFEKGMWLYIPDFIMTN